MSFLVVKKGATTIVDGDMNAGALMLDMSHGQQRTIDASSPILADVIAFIDLVTQNGEARFIVEETHSSLALALDKFFRHPQQVLGVDDLIVEWTDESSVLHRWTAADAAWRAASAGSLPMGIASRIEYVVSVAAWTYENSEGGSLPTIPTQTAADTQTLSLSTAGTSTITLGAYVRERYLRLTIGTGTGIYTRNVVLDVADREDGNVVDVMVAMPASTNPTVKFYDASTGGTLLLTMPTDTVAATFHLKFIYSSTSGAWELWDYTQLP